MFALAASVFIASLTGSGHCMGMCGPFVGLMTIGRGPGARRRQQIFYHGGRLVAYALFGIIAGLLGELLDLGGRLVGLQQTATKLAGIMMIAVGLGWLLRRGGNIVTPTPLTTLGTTLGGWLSRGKWRSEGGRFFGLGLATTFMPCGWLYVFAVNAAGTGSAVYGGAMMVAFWLGTLPALVALGAGLGYLSAPILRLVPQMGAVLVVLVGLFTVLQRAPINATAGEARANRDPVGQAPCHDP